MNKRKNDEIAGIPVWLWMVIPVVLLAVGGAGVLLGQWMAQRDTQAAAAMTATASARATDRYWYMGGPTATPTNTPTNFPLTMTAWARERTPPLDVTFLIDTTSSMGDEIFQLQNNILFIAGEIDKLNSDVRYGLVLYREWNNYQYVSQMHNFTSDVTQFQQTLSQVTADSGDNNREWAEALNVGFYQAVHELSWRDENTIKLMFLVGDASAHIDHPNEPHKYAEIMLDAAAKGIKIHSVASSGLDPQGEYMFRQISQVTMGHFIFLTYDTDVPVIANAAPGDNRPDLNVGEPEDVQGVGEYTVEQLDDIVLRLITDELAAPQGGS